ncbi:MAG: hypothetical protein NW205_04340 [Hyphomicrobiaceae bacterium]|nr:hypothetical protein [Hyphomicrobiaceae bacterium]
MSLTITPDTPPASAAPQRVGGGLPAAYVAAWSLVGTLSAGYLGIAILLPDMLGLATPTEVAAITEAVPSAPLDTAPAPADDTPMATRMELARLRTELSRREEADRRSAERAAERADAGLSANSSATDDPRTERIAAAPSPVPAPVAAAPATPAAAEPLPEMREASEQAIAEATLLDPDAGSADVTTGSITPPPLPDRAPPKSPVVETVAVVPVPQKPQRPAEPVRRPAAEPPISFGQAVVKPATTVARAAPAAMVLGVGIARANSVEALRQTWNTLRQRNGAALAGLSPRYQITGVDPAAGTMYSLIAGPLATADDIARTCEVALASGLTCATQPYAGNAL